MIAAGTPAQQAREEARRILSERRYRGSDVPRPLHDVLEWLGRRFHFVGRFVDWLAGQVGGHGVVWLVLAAVVVALAAWAAGRLARRRGSRAAALARAAAAERSLDPRELERLAEEAEARGDLEIALRLRFRAGLLRLDRAQAIALEPSTTSGEVSRTLRSRDFEEVASSFDAVVYGRRPPGDEDVELSRAGWRRVLAAVGAR